MIFIAVALILAVVAITTFNTKSEHIYVREDSSRRLISSAQIARVLRENKTNQNKRDQK
jgi:hypothetical protein